MRGRFHVRLTPALCMFLLVFAPTSAAQEPEPDEEFQLLPPINETSPEQFLIPETCDPLDLILCVGPIGDDAPVVVAVSSNGVVLSVWLHEGESNSYGPIQENVTVPVTGTEVPLTLCPNTCPVPIMPEAEVTGTVTVCLTVATLTECLEDPGLLETVFTLAGFVGETVDGADRDHDLVPNAADNCPDHPNLSQSDEDLDGTGDACDDDPTDLGTELLGDVDELQEFLDQDGDRIPTLVDNCPEDSNLSQLDSDADGQGDACDPDTQDLVGETTTFVSELRDSLDGDQDGIPDSVDNCPDTPNADQLDTDLDGTGNACDPDTQNLVSELLGDVGELQDSVDRDGDRVPDELDNCPDESNPFQADSDLDGTGDGCDEDTIDPVQETRDSVDGDGDNIPDDADNCPGTPNEGQADEDLDGTGDACDPDATDGPVQGALDLVDDIWADLDRDGDGVPDSLDNCPNDANAYQEDGDLDGRGNVCDSSQPDFYCGDPVLNWICIHKVPGVGDIPEDYRDLPKFFMRECEEGDWDGKAPCHTGGGNTGILIYVLGSYIRI